MEHARIDITAGLDGEAVVLAVFDLGEEEISASAYAVGSLALGAFLVIGRASCRERVCLVV